MVAAKAITTKVVVLVEAAVDVHALSAMKKAIWQETAQLHLQVVVEEVQEPASNAMKRVIWLENVQTKMPDHLAALLLVSSVKKKAICLVNVQMRLKNAMVVVEVVEVALEHVSSATRKVTCPEIVPPPRQVVVAALVLASNAMKRATWQETAQLHLQVVAVAEVVEAALEPASSATKKDTWRENVLMAMPVAIRTSDLAETMMEAIPAPITMTTQATMAMTATLAGAVVELQQMEVVNGAIVAQHHQAGEDRERKIYWDGQKNVLSYELRFDYHFNTLSVDNNNKSSIYLIIIIL